jgi:hypothetical protein
VFGSAALSHNVGVMCGEVGILRSFLPHSGIMTRAMWSSSSRIPNGMNMEKIAIEMYPHGLCQLRLEIWSLATLNDI